MTRVKKLANTRWFFILVATVVIYLSWRVAQPLAMTLVTAGVFAVVFTPLEHRIRMVVKSQKLSALLMVVAVFLLIIIPIFLIAVLLVDQAQGLLALASAQSDFLKEFDVQSLGLFQSLPESVQSWLLTLDLSKIGSAAASWAVTNLQAGLSDVVRVLLNVGVFFVSLYYILHDREKIHAQLLVLSPLRDKLDEQILSRITGTVRGVVFGALIVALIQAVFATIGMAIFGVPGFLLWGALAIIAAQIPLVGMGIIMVPAVGYLYISGHPGAAIGLAVWSVVIVGMVDNVISPFLIEGRTKMHALLILVSILGGLQLFGPIGFIIGPTILAALLVVVDLYKSGILEKGA